MLFGAWLVNRNVFYDTSLLLTLLIANFFISDWYFKWKKIGEDSQKFLRILKKDEE